VSVVLDLKLHSGNCFFLLLEMKGQKKKFQIC